MPSGIVLSPDRKEQPALPPAVLQHVASHVRRDGRCLIMLQGDGAIVFHDRQASPFHLDYVVPALSGANEFQSQLRQHASRLTAADAPQAWDFLPGALLWAMPYVERRQVQAIMLVASRHGGDEAPAAARDVCGHLGLDSTHLIETSSDLVPCDADRPAAGIAPFMDLLSARLRIAEMEGEIKSLSTQLANTYEELTLIEQVSGGMRVNRGVEDFFRQACQDVIQVINVRAMGAALSPEKCQQQPMLHGDLPLPSPNLHRLSTQLLAALAQRRSYLLVNNTAADPNYQWLQPQAKQLLAVPLLRGEHLLGCFFALDKLSGEFDSVDAKLLTSIANESAIYLENALLFANLHDLMMGLLHSLTSAVDAKDTYTCGHSERVALLARHLAVRIGLADDDVERIYMAGLLHDVGKIGVPESVLQKTGRLTPEEFEQMKKHSQIGARILADVKQLEDVIPGVLHHHERYDGRGYPAGLHGQGIPLMGRIICLADCLDAMTSNRTYRRALPPEVALTEIRRCSGTQFDPALAEVLLKITPEQFRLLLRDHELQAKRLLELQEILRAA